MRDTCQQVNALLVHVSVIYLNNLTRVFVCVLSLLYSAAKCPDEYTIFISQQYNSVFTLSLPSFNLSFPADSDFFIFKNGENKNIETHY